MQINLHVGVDLLDGVPGTVDLLATHIAGAMQDLTLKVGEIDRVKIDQADPSDASCRKIEGDRGTKPTGSDAEDAGRLDPLLPLEGNLGHDEVARIARDLVVAKFDSRRAGRVQNAIAHKKGVIGNLSLPMVQGKEASP